MCLDMLLEVLRPLEGLAAEVAFVRLQWDVYANVRRDVVALDSGRAACAPLTCKVEIVSALPANMTLAHMVIEALGRVGSFAASLPLTGEIVDGTSWRALDRR